MNAMGVRSSDYLHESDRRLMSLAMKSTRTVQLCTVQGQYRCDIMMRGKKAVSTAANTTVLYCTVLNVV